MSDSTRLIMLFLCFIGIGFVAYQAIDDAMTEKLDDLTIRKTYQIADTLYNNPQGLKEFLQKRLDDSYIKTGSMSYEMKDKPEQVTPLQLNKEQTIDTVIRGMSAMQLANYIHTIADIKFTEDHKYAYVSSTEQSSGTLDFPLPEDKKFSVPFQSASSCIDTLAVVSKVIKLVRTECKHKVAIQQ